MSTPETNSDHPIDPDELYDLVEAIGEQIRIIRESPNSVALTRQFNLNVEALEEQRINVLTSAAEQGHLGAKTLLAAHFYQAKEHEKAFKLYKEVADNKIEGQEDNSELDAISEELWIGEARQTVSYMYKKGEGVEQDPTKALEYLQKACEINTFSSRVAMYELARHLWHGYSPLEKPNKEDALHWLKKSAELSLIPAMYTLATLYMDDDSVQDLDRAQELLQELLQDLQQRLSKENSAFGELTDDYMADIKRRYEELTNCPENPAAEPA